jgi:hypothetical protein
VLGLYADDWWYLIEPQHATAPFSLDRLHYFVGFGSNYVPRPLQGLTAFLVTSIAGSSPVAIQFLSALLVLASALSLRAWLNRFMSVLPGYSNLAGDFAVVFWLAMPWMLGVTAWPAVAHNLGSQIVFTELARLLLARERLTLGLAATVSAAIVASSLFYEAFYFAIVPVVIVYAILGRGPAKNRPALALLLGICLIAQGIPIAFNRYSASLSLVTAKHFNPHWLQWVFGNLLAMPNAVLNSLPEYRLLGLLLAILTAICALVICLPASRPESGPRVRTYLSGLLAIALAILFISDVIYSAARYGLASTGLGSRTFFPSSLSFTLAFFAMICTAFIPGSKMVKVTLFASSAGLVLVLALAQHHRIEDWGYAWHEEVRILQSAPVDEIRRLPVQASILYSGPYEYHGVGIFTVEWDLTAAVASLGPLSQGRRPFEQLHAIYPAGDHINWSWDGRTLWKKPSHGRARAFPVQQLYLWRQGATCLQQVTPDFQWPSR